MGTHHRSPEYLRFAAAQRARLVKGLPTPCHLCGQMITSRDRVDLDHLIPVSVDPTGLLNPGNVRLAHRACNRRAGQLITVAKKRGKKNARRVPEW